MTPEDITRRSEEISQLLPSATDLSSSSIIGRANASPTIVSIVILNFSTVSHSSLALNVLEARVATRPPCICVLNAVRLDVPCISGAAQSCLISFPDPVTRFARSPASRGVSGISSPSERKVSPIPPMSPE